jgi:hypothetical protein
VIVRECAACIPNRDLYISQHPVASNPLDRGATEPGAECRVFQAGEIGELRRGEIRARAQIDVSGRRRKFVPRAGR